MTLLALHALQDVDCAICICNYKGTLCLWLFEWTLPIIENWSLSNVHNNEEHPGAGMHSEVKRALPACRLASFSWITISTPSSSTYKQVQSFISPSVNGQQWLHTMAGYEMLAIEGWTDSSRKYKALEELYASSIALNASLPSRLAAGLGLQYVCACQAVNLNLSPWSATQHPWHRLSWGSKSIETKDENYDLWADLYGLGSKGRPHNIQA